jgi:methenyltetrahydrofolate cyclohydrolase
VTDQTIASYLEALAAREPTPGGGTAAALHAAQSAALLGMVARYSQGPKFESSADKVEQILAEADQLRGDALSLAAADAAAFGAVADAYKLPRASDDERAARSHAIAGALATAAEPPATTIAIGVRLVWLCQQLQPLGNRTVITDVAAAADAAAAAISTGRVNVEVNLTGIRDDAARAGLEAQLASVDDSLQRAGTITSSVREMIK